jgi:hypothetical protein
MDFIKIQELEACLTDALDSKDPDWINREPGKDCPLAKCLSHMASIFEYRDTLVALSKRVHELGLTKYHGKSAYNFSATDPIIKLIQSICPDSRSRIIEIGCGSGGLLRYLSDECGYLEAHGLEHPSLRGCSSHQGLNVFYCDIEDQNLSDIRMNLCSKYDLVVCTEVAEHISSGAHMRFISLLVSLSNIVLMSSPPEGDRAFGHIGCRDPDYWIRNFGNAGYTSYIPSICGKETGSLFYIFADCSANVTLDKGYDELFLAQTKVRDAEWALTMLMSILAENVTGTAAAGSTVARLWEQMYIFPAFLRSLKGQPSSLSFMQLIENTIPRRFAHPLYWK